MSKIADKISKVFDSATANGGLVHLNTEQADKFIDYIVDESIIMKDAKVVKMSKPTKKVATLDINDEIFVPGIDGESLENIKATALEKELVTQEIVAVVKIKDDELEDNIEGNAFKDHLFRLIAKKGSTQLEKVGLYAKKVTGAKTVDRMFNGFITETERNGNVVDATDTTLFADRFIDRTKLTKTRKAIPDALSDLVDKLYMPNKLIWDYEDLYITGNNKVPTDRIGGLKFNHASMLGKGRAIIKVGGASNELLTSAVAGDTVIAVVDSTSFAIGQTIAIALGQGQEHIAKVTAVDITLMTITIDTAVIYPIDATDTKQKLVFEVETNGLDIFLTPANNMLYGIQREITLEPERRARERATYFVLTARIDTILLNPTASVVLKGLQTR